MSCDTVAVHDRNAGHAKWIFVMSLGPPRNVDAFCFRVTLQLSILPLNVLPTTDNMSTLEYSRKTPSQRSADTGHIGAALATQIGMNAIKQPRCLYEIRIVISSHPESCHRAANISTRSKTSPTQLHLLQNDSTSSPPALSLIYYTRRRIDYTTVQTRTVLSERPAKRV